MAGAPPLTGVRVLERTSSLAGRSAGMLLADLGADVVRMVGPDDAEQVSVPEQLPGWMCWNRGKTLVAVADRAETARLVQRADILLVDDPPVALAAAGLDAHSLRVEVPALVSVWMPPVATAGRWSDLPTDHLLLDAIGGFAAHHPATADQPVASVVPTRHLVQGALASVAAMVGLLARERDGWGRSAVVTGLHAEAATLATLVARSVDGPQMISPGKFLPGGPNFRLYQGSEGRWLFLAALSPELFIKALDVLDRLDIFAHPDVAGEFLNVLRPEVGVTVGAQLDAAFATATTDEWLQRFRDAGVPVAAVGDPAEWLASDVIAHACPPVVRRSTTLGEVVLPGPPVTLAQNPGVVGELAEPGAAAGSAEIWTGSPRRATPVGPAPSDDQRPLADLRVIDLATFLAGPFVSTLLAAHGADVVKIEAPAGDPYAVFSASYAVVNEHKPRLAADLRDPAARAGVLELVAVADVVVDNLTASSLARLGMTPEVFAGANPDLVRCSVTAYGAEGPHAELPGFDPIMQTLSGLVAVQGGAGRPISTAAPVHDVATGCVGALGTLVALWVRRRDGHGQRVFTSLAATSTYLQSGELTNYPGRPGRPVGGPDFAGPSAWQRFYRAADRWIAVSASSAAQRAAMLALVAPTVQVADDDTLAAAFAARLRTRSADEWTSRLAVAGVPACNSINRSELDDPFLVEQRYSHVVATPHVGRLEVLGGYTDWSDAVRRPPLPVEALAVDRTAVLARWRDASAAAAAAAAQQQQQQPVEPRDDGC